MALNKRKVLDAARKFAQKGAQEKALKEYAKLLKVDARDAKLLLEIGDAHRRWGQNEEAISHYVRVAEQYKQGGFDARAVAVFKQILNLDGKRYPAYVSLAELYQRMGLDGEAVNALQTAADGYHKEGQKPEALELLRKMATLDPSNTTSRMKVAEMLRQEEMLVEAVSEYEAVIEEMVRQGENDTLIPVYERILEIKPERADIEFSLARNLVQLSQSVRAEPYARRAFDHEPDAEGHFDLLTGIYTELGNTDELTVVTKAMAQVYRERGDEDQARELMQRLANEDACSVPDQSASAAAPQDGPAKQDSLPDDDFLDDDFLATDDDGDSEDDSFIDLDGDDNLDLDLADDDQADDLEAGPDDAGTSGTAVPEGDPDQLFAEASVYLRYGKRDQAIASLEAILEQEPNHRGALEKIGECHAESGDSPRAVEYWLKTAHLALDARDDVAVDNLRERIAALDPEAAEGLVSAPEQDAPSAADDLDADAEDDVELDLDMEIDEEESPESGGDPAELDEIALEDSLDELVLDETPEEDESIEFELDAASASVSVSESAGGSSSHSAKISEELEEAEFYMEQELFDEAEAVYNRVLEMMPNHPSAMLRLGELRAARGEDPSASGAAAMPKGEVTLDPADLPFDENDVDEGVALDSDPSDDDGSVELGENSELDIAADVELEIDSDADEGVAEDVDVEIDVDLDVDVDVEVDDADGLDLDDDGTLDVENSETTIDEDALGLDEEDAEALFDGSDVDDVDELSDPGGDCEVDLDLDDDGTEEAPIVLDTPTSEKMTPLLADDEDEDPISEAASEADEEVEESEPEVAAAAVSEASESDGSPDIAQHDEDDSFDLAAELRETLEDKDERIEQGETTNGGDTTSEDEGFASIFKDFKSGVAKTLAPDDYDTRFDLGIAYHGMDLYDDALGEFRICLDSAGHRLESLHMMGVCAIELGRFADASNHLEQALSSEDLPAQKEAGLRFDLARSFEAQGDVARAKEAFEAAKAADATIPGVDECIARVTQRLESGDGPLDDDSEAAEGFESFDDLIAEAEADESPDEAFESFDDIVAEAEASDAMPEELEVASVAVEEEPAAESQAEVACEPEPEPPASKSDAKKPKKKKKKRISFV